MSAAAVMVVAVQLDAAAIAAEAEAVEGHAKEASLKSDTTVEALGLEILQEVMADEINRNVLTTEVQALRIQDPLERRVRTQMLVPKKDFWLEQNL